MLDKKTFKFLVYGLLVAVICLMLLFAIGYVPNELQGKVSDWVGMMLSFIFGLVIQKKEQG